MFKRRAKEARRKDGGAGSGDSSSYLDSLTGLYTKRYVDEVLDRECQRARRYGNHLSCLMIDLDDFQAFRDKWGATAADGVLRQVAALLSASLRDSDIAARYGNNRFCLLLPETPDQGADRLAERLRRGVATQPLMVGGRSVAVTASIGIFAPERPAEIRSETFLDHAVEALETAKSAGKNAVREYRGVAPAPGVRDVA
jgi:diguanylate cyclase (GGDEF)-like protein